MSGALGETLVRLSELLPVWFRMHDGMFQVNLPITRSGRVDHWDCLYYQDEDGSGWELDDLSSLPIWEWALRQECELRRWNWYARACPYARAPYEYSVVTDREFLAQADTPAHALALALLAALAPAAAGEGQSAGEVGG